MSTSEETLIGVQSKYLAEKLSTMDVAEYKYLSEINRIQKQLPGRAICSFTFKNNLISVDGNSKPIIKYLKLGHVLHGQEAFVYERVNVSPDFPVYFNQYVIGTNISNKKVTVSEEGVNVSSKVLKGEHKLVEDNIYDKLYIQFVVEREVGGVKKEYVYNQSYQQFLKEELFDIFAVTGTLTPEFLNLMNIQLYFDPAFNKITNNSDGDTLKLRLAVTMPTGYIIETTSVPLK